ncbi:MAG: penicillin-binding protein [Desulfuromonas sp.]|nr:MAG: penicillin-binding protein [Desulfuromonas sp.]
MTQSKTQSKISRKVVRLTLIVLLIGALLAVGGPLAAYFYVANSLPKVDTLADYRPPVITRILSDDGQVISELYDERRIVVPVSRMPEQLVQAFVAAEDSNFFKHRGIDLVSILRAALKNIKAGGIVQGGSTITQQVAKSLLLTPEKKFERKFKEAILAYRMEKRLSKEEILYLYLNQIFLGHGAYGVQAAAENYFDKDVDQLSLAECSLLAGLPKAPSRYSPYSHFAKARERQKYVLTRMVEDGFISQQEAEAAYTTHLEIRPRVNQHILDAAYFTEQVRRYLEQTYGRDRLYRDGLVVETSMSLPMQLAAQQAVQENLHAHDQRQGYRGPQEILDQTGVEAFLADQLKRFAERQPQVGERFDAIVAQSAGDPLMVRFADFHGRISLESASWAGPPQVVSHDQPAQGNLEGGRSQLPIGARVQVRLIEIPEQGPWVLELSQDPFAQGALLALEPQTGLIKAMVGGYNFRSSQFNRVIQAKRLPGSAIKPLIYAAALDRGYTPATVILDTPLIFREQLESGEIKEWKPKNYSKKFYGPVPLRTALAKSHNVITIKVLEDIGVRYASKYIRKLGIESHIDEDLTLALGSSALTPMELASAYGVLANGGVRVRPAYITRIADRDGRILESVDPADFPDGPQPGQKLNSPSQTRVISPETAYLTTNLMESVVRSGTGWRAKSLKRPVAGKTGTTNDLKDAWFVGYVPQLLTVTWVGYDQERPLGDKETGSRAAAPAWVTFMEQALADLPTEQFPVPDSIEFRPIDPTTGLLAPEDSPDVVIEAFAPGSSPVRYALEENKPQAKDFFRLDLEEY